jgi:hypothetical protein
VNLGGVLFPHFHFHSVFGGISGDELPEVGHHDPREDGWTIQGFEFGLSARANEHLEGYGTLHLFFDRRPASWDHHFEEWFGKIKDLPGGFELRGGRYLNRLGFHNSTHLHGWDFADTHLVNGRFLGDDGLSSIGGEASWKIPVRWTSVLSVSAGAPPDDGAHEHGHAEEGREPEFEAAGALFDDVIATANWTNGFDYNDFHQFRGGLSGAWGGNRWGKTTQIYGAHFEYQWRENGYEAGGRHFRWRTEAMIRSFEATSGHLPGEEHAEEGHEDHARGGSLDEFGIYSSLVYGFGKGLDLGLRGDFVSGIAQAGLDERFRVSPAMTYYLNDSRALFLRVQYNWDHSSDFGSEHGIWGQIGINWGGPEVR